MFRSILLEFRNAYVFFYKTKMFQQNAVCHVCQILIYNNKCKSVHGCFMINVFATDAQQWTMLKYYYYYWLNKPVQINTQKKIDCCCLISQMFLISKFTSQLI